MLRPDRTSSKHQDTIVQRKLKNFREVGNILKTEEEKKTMAEKGRFKKNREFKKPLMEDLESENTDIRSFVFRTHHPDFNEKLYEKI